MCTHARCQVIWKSGLFGKTFREMPFAIGGEVVESFAFGWDAPDQRDVDVWIEIFLMCVFTVSKLCWQTPYGSSSRNVKLFPFENFSTFLESMSDLVQSHGHQRDWFLC